MKREGDIFMFFNVFTSFLLFLFSVPSFKKTKSSLRLFLSAQSDLLVKFFFCMRRISMFTVFAW